MSDKSIVGISKEIAKSVDQYAPKNRKGTISNVDKKGYQVDVDLKTLGNITLDSKSILTQYAGKNYGFICSPREKQSVIVAPVDGDYAKAIILGRVFESKNGISEVPPHNLGDTLFRHELGSEWVFSYTQPTVGKYNLDIANRVILNNDPSVTDNTTIRFIVTNEDGTELLENQVIRVVLQYIPTNSTKEYLRVVVEWETVVQFKDDNKTAYIDISDANTIVGGPLYSSEEGQFAKHYRISEYFGTNTENRKYKGMLVSPPKGVANFSHYMGMGLFMDEYPSRQAIGTGSLSNDGFLLDENGDIKSWKMNDDAFNSEVMNKLGKIHNFPRGSLTLKHYSNSGMYIMEKVNKTYPNLIDSAHDNNNWYQSSITYANILMRQTPDFPNIKGLDDSEKPMASFIMEDDCKNAINNSIHIRIAQDNTGCQAISEQDIEYYGIIHRDNDDNNSDLVELPGTRPSRLQFYDLKRKVNESEQWKCIYDAGSNCKLNEDKKGNIVPEVEQIASYGSGKNDSKTGGKKCPSWPGCIEGHFTHKDIDMPLAIRDKDLWIHNMPLLIKPKANMELAHYTGSGLYIEEQLPKTDNNEINYDKIYPTDSVLDDNIATVGNYHAPKVLLRLREWDYLPNSDETNKIDYTEGVKNNAFEPKRYDSCILEFDTLYGDRRGSEDGDKKGSYEFVNSETNLVEFYDEHESYKTANRITLAQQLYGNWIKELSEDEEPTILQKGNRLIFEDLLDDENKPLSIWSPTTSTEDPELKPKDEELEDNDKDTRILMPKGKLELMHYTNSGLIINELDYTTVANNENDYSALSHKMDMSLLFNYWSMNNKDNEYRPVNHLVDGDAIDPMSIMKWEETGTVIPSLKEYTADTTSAVDWFVYLNAHRDQHITLDEPNPWWNESEAADITAYRSGAYIAIRESDNGADGTGDDTAPRAPIIEATDTKNSIKMNPTVGSVGSQIDITNRENQFTNEEGGVNRIVMNAISQVMSLLNGQEGGSYNATSGGEPSEGNSNNSIVMDRTNKQITIQDANDNKITINEDGIKIEEKVNGNTIIINSSGIKIEDTNGNIITTASSGINLEDSNGNKVEMAGGGITVEAAANVDVKGVNVTVNGSNVTIKGGSLTIDTTVPGISPALCQIPFCIYSGAPHIINTTPTKP